MFVFQSLDTECESYVSQVMPSILNIIRSENTNFRDYFFQQLAVLISIVGKCIHKYLDDIYSLVKVCILYYQLSSFNYTMLHLLISPGILDPKLFISMHINQFS